MLSQNPSTSYAESELQVGTSIVSRWIHVGVPAIVPPVETRAVLAAIRFDPRLVLRQLQVHAGDASRSNGVGQRPRVLAHNFRVQVI